jgi:hypothetical protein
MPMRMARGRPRHSDVIAELERQARRINAGCERYIRTEYDLIASEL